MLVELAELQTNIFFCGSIMFVAVSTKESKFVVHIFLTEYREFYRLEDLWADSAKTVYEEE